MILAPIWIAFDLLFKTNINFYNKVEIQPKWIALILQFSNTNWFGILKKDQGFINIYKPFHRKKASNSYLMLL
jgi:hypothetical protein